MKLEFTNDAAQVQIIERDSDNGEESEATLMRTELANAKAFAKELRKETNPRVRQQWEHEYYKQIKEEYGSAKVAGALLGMVWKFCGEAENG